MKSGMVCSRRKAALACALLGAAGGCAPDFTEQWEVTKPRILTAKVLIDGDTEGRARPRSGETFSIRYYMMSPERPQPKFTAETAVCAGTVLSNGTLACIQEIPLPTLQTAPYEGDDQLLLTGLFVPPIADDLPPPFDQLKRIAMFGGMCANGDVERVPNTSIEKNAVTDLFQCTNNADADYKLPLPFSMSIWLDRGPGDDNHHPSFACSEDEASACVTGVEHEIETSAKQKEKITTPGAIVLALPKEVAGDGPREQLWEPWDPAVELPWDNCAEAPDSLPKLRAGTKDYTIYVRLDPTDREDYELAIQSNQGEQLEQRREEIVVSHAITTKGGKVDGYASVVRAEALDSEAEIDVKYTPPRQSEKKDEHIADTGRLVRFFFTLRDQRGGVDFTTRELCVLPPED